MASPSTPQVKIVISELGQHVQRLMAALALQIIANLVASPARGGTPVDTGWARANWVPNIGAPITTTVGERPTGGVKVPSAGGLTGGAANAVKVLTYKLGQGPIYITNNVPYIERLNAGSSKQAPAGFIQAAVARAAQSVARGKTGRYGR